MKNNFALIAALTLVLGLPGTAAADGTRINNRTAADPTGTVEISNTAGTVVVTGWNRNEVEVTGELGEGTERLEFTKGDKVTRIKVVLPNRSHHVDDTDLIVKVPLGSTLSINTVSADIVAQGVRGAQRLQSVSGDLRTEASGEDLECRTVSGDVQISGSGKRGLVSITTVSGDVNAMRVAGEVNGSTVSGDFSMEMGETTRSRLRSTSGDLSVSGQLTTEARVDIESISGNVDLDLSGPLAAEFEVSSFNGEIHNCFGPEPVRTSEYAPGREWRYKAGTGTARVRIKTLNGDIGICKN